MMITFDPLKDPSHFQTNYKILSGSIQPRPIAVISTLNPSGNNNVAPFSFFTAVSAAPMLVAFCPLISSETGKKKDTLKNIEREKEFCLNFSPASLANNIFLCGTPLPFGEDESKLAGLTMIDSHKIKARRIQESPIHFECRLKDILSYGEHLGAGTLVVGEVVLAHLSEQVYQEGHILTDIFDPIGRGAGPDWIYCRERIALGKPQNRG